MNVTEKNKDQALKLIKKYQTMAVFENEKLVSLDQHAKFDGDTPFHVAAYDGNIEDLKFMLLCGINVNILGDIGNTALHYAVMTEQIEAINFLINMGASLKIKNEYGDLPEDLVNTSNNELVNAVSRNST